MELELGKDKMIETNWGFYEDMEIVADGGDDGNLWDTITIGKPSKLKYINKEFRH